MTRYWHIVTPREGFPATVLLLPSHWQAAWDYADKDGIYATFNRDGRQSYQGGDTPDYRLDGS